MSYKLTEWCRERRFTEGLNISVFYDQLGFGTASEATRKLKLLDSQRLGLWKRRNRLPWAVYLALLEAYGTPKDHKPPKISYAKLPVRLPIHFERFISPPPAQCTHTEDGELAYRKTTLGYYMCPRCGVRAPEDYQPAEAEAVVVEADTDVSESEFPRRRRTDQTPDEPMRHEVVIKVEIVPQTAGAEAPATATATTTTLPPEREIKLIGRIRELEQLLEERTRPDEVDPPPAEVVNRPRTYAERSDRAERFDRDARHRIRTVANKAGPQAAREFAHQLATTGNGHKSA